MVKRRSLDDWLTPDQKSFLAGDVVQQPAVTPRPKKGRKAKPRSKQKPDKENPAMNKPAFRETPSSPILPQPEIRALPSLVGLNTRIEDRLSDALLRAHMDRRLRRVAASKVQDIVGEALVDWMKKHGYLN